jgi:hypothetical protein
MSFGMIAAQASPGPIARVPSSVLILHGETSSSKLSRPQTLPGQNRLGMHASCRPPGYSNLSGLHESLASNVNNPSPVQSRTAKVPIHQLHSLAGRIQAFLLVLPRSHIHGPKDVSLSFRASSKETPWRESSGSFPHQFLETGAQKDAEDAATVMLLDKISIGNLA